MTTLGQCHSLTLSLAEVVYQCSIVSGFVLALADFIRAPIQSLHELHASSSS